MRTAQIASLPERESTLLHTVQSLLPQVDKIFVGLNNYKRIPRFLKHDKIEAKIFDNSMGDAVKFYDVEKRDGYILTCDDDLVYPENYADYMIEKVNKYKAVVSLLGKRYDRHPIVSFRTGYSELYRCLGTVLRDREVHVGGTGAMCFHTDHIKVKFSDFQKPNMADLWMAKIAREQNIPIWVVAHSRNFVGYHHYDWRIWNHCIDPQYQTDLIKSILEDEGTGITNNNITAPGNVG